MEIEDKISFALPVDIVKGKNAKGEARYFIEGLASTTDKDNAGETLLAKQFRLDDFKQLNWNHMGQKDPGAILGEIEKHYFNNKGLNVRAELYPEIPQAQSAIILAKALKKRGKRLQLSIEGQVLQRGSNDKNHPDYKKVLKANLTGVALTPMAVNQNTFADLIEKGITNVELIYDTEEEELFKSAYEGKLKDEDQINCPQCKIALVEGKCPDCGYIQKAMGTGNTPGYEALEPGKGKNEKENTVAENVSVKKAMTAGATTGQQTENQPSNGAALKQEDLEGANKKSLSKSQVYEAIFNYFCPINYSEVKSIYELTEKISTMSKTVINKETLNKAFEILKLAAEENNAAVEKTLDTALELIKSEHNDLGKDEIVEALVKAEYTKEMAEEAAEKHVKNKKKDKKDKKDGKDGKDGKDDDDDDDDKDDKDMGEMKKSLESMKIQIDSLQDNTDVKVGALGVILKSQTEMIETLVEMNTKQGETLNKALETIEKLEKSPVRKAAVVSSIERHSKPDEDGLVTYNLADKTQKKALINKLEQLAGDDGQGNYKDKSLMKAASDIELVGYPSNPMKLLPYLEDIHKIKVVMQKA